MSEAIALERCDTSVDKDRALANPAKKSCKGLNQIKRKASRAAASRSRLKRKQVKKAEEADDELREALVENAQSGIRGKRQYKYGLVVLVGRIGSWISAAGARAP